MRPGWALCGHDSPAGTSSEATEEGETACQSPKAKTATLNTDAQPSMTSPTVLHDSRAEVKSETSTVPLVDLPHQSLEAQPGQSLEAVKAEQNSDQITASNRPSSLQSQSGDKLEASLKSTTDDSMEDDSKIVSVGATDEYPGCPPRRKKRTRKQKEASGRVRAEHLRRIQLAELERNSTAVASETPQLAGELFYCHDSASSQIRSQMGSR